MSDSLLKFQFSVPFFVSSWSHCSEMANYLSNQVSSFFSNPDTNANLLSTIINEILETIYNHSDDSTIKVNLLKDHRNLIAEFNIPLTNTATRSFYIESINELKDPSSLDSKYKEGIFTALESDNIDPAFGFLEIVNNYEVGLTFEDDGSSFKLQANIPVN